VWEIKDWTHVFETRHSRSEAGPRRYLLVPTDRQSEAYVVLMRTSAGLVAYAVFVGLLRIAARCPRRGVLEDEKGPFTTARIADKLRIPVGMVERAIATLSAAEVGWLRRKSAGKAPDEPAPKRRESAGEAPDERRKSAGEAPVKVGDSGQGHMDRDRDRDSAPPSASSPPGKKKPAKTVPVPPSLNTPEFRTAWAAWAEYRRQAKKPLTEIGAKRLLAKFATWGPAASAAAIDESIANGWQGVFDHGDGPARGGTSSDRGSARVHGGVAEARRDAQSAREFDEPEIPMPIFRPTGLAGAATDDGTGRAAGGGGLAPAASGACGRGVAG
jgi:hypothetical protein